MRSSMLAHTPADLPYFVFGHSMGSYVIRDYIARHGEGLAGAILCGTGYVAPLVSKAGNMLLPRHSCRPWQRLREQVPGSMATGGFNKVIDDPAHGGGLDFRKRGKRRPLPRRREVRLQVSRWWLCDAHGAHARGVQSRRPSGAIPRDLPLLFVAGAEDPVGSMGEGVRKVAEMAREAGVQDVEVRIYEGMRHEILNERDAQLVYDDVATWLDEHLDGGAQ